MGRHSLKLHSLETCKNLLCSFQKSLKIDVATILLEITNRKSI